MLILRVLTFVCLAMSKAYIANGPQGLAVDYVRVFSSKLKHGFRTDYELKSTVWFLSVGGTNQWSWSWATNMTDTVTQQPWTAQQMSDETKKLIGVSVDTDATTWTIESAACEGFDEFARSSKPGLHTYSRTDPEKDIKKPTKKVVKRQEQLDAVCSWTIRPDSSDALVGWELSDEVWFGS